MDGKCLPPIFGDRELGLEYANIGQTVTVLWPPSGIALGNTLEPICGTVLLRRRKNFSNALDKVSDVIALVLFAAVISTIVSASLGTLGLFVGGEIAVADLGPIWLTWWLGDGMGVLVISPVLLAGIGMARMTSALFSSTKVLEAFILIVALTVVGHAIFGSSKVAGLGYFPVSLSMFPFIIWSALRFGSIGAASVALVASLLAINGTVQGTGPFAAASAMESMILWCLFADLMVITGLILAAINSGREKALPALRISNESLEYLVQKRTNELFRSNLELHAALAERQRLQIEMNQINEERQKIIGQELHDGLGKQITGITFLVSAIHDTLSAKSAPEVSTDHQVKHQLNEAMTVIRSLSRGLYPVALETGGFPPHFIIWRNTHKGLQESSVMCDVRLVRMEFKTIALNLYHIAQEAVCNALRHSKAQRIEIIPLMNQDLV